MKDNKQFSSLEIVKLSWDMFKKNSTFLLIVGVIVLLMFVILPSSLKQIYNKSDSYTAKAIVDIFIYFIQFMNVLIELGLVFVALRLVKKRQTQVSDLFLRQNLFLKYLAASTINIIMISLGFIFLVIPGIILGIKFMFFPYFIIEGSGIIESLQKSFHLTSGLELDLFVFNIIMLLIIIAGILLFFVGLIVAIPLVFIATALLYDKLRTKFDLSQSPLK